MATGEYGTGHLPAAVTDWRRPAASFAIALAFFVLALASIELTRGDNRFAAVWLPNAVAAALMLRVQLARTRLTLMAIVTASVLCNLTMGHDPAAATIMAVANGCEVGVAVWLLRRWCGHRPDPAMPQFMGYFLLAACLIAPAISASIVAAQNWIDAGAPHASDVLQWFLTDSLGMMLCLPSLLIMWDSRRSVAGVDRIWNAQRGSTLWIMGAGFTAVVAIFTQSSYPLLFICASVVIMFAYHLGLLATVLGTVWVAAVAIYATANDSGPIALMSAPFNEKVIVLQAFLASVFLSGVPIAAAVRRQRRLTERLARQKRKLSLLANNVTDAVLRFDLEGMCIDASPSIRTVLDRDPQDLIGRKVDARVHPDAQDSISDAMTALISGAQERMRFTYRRLLDDSEGDAVYIEADCAVVSDREYGEKTIIVCARDVTERISLEAQLVRARRHAEAAAAAKSQFLANMSHEIRTPMNGVLGFAELLQHADLPAEQARQVDLIAESGQSMMRLLNDILDISKIEAEQAATVMEPVNLAHMLDGCVKLQSANAATKSIALSCTIQPGLPDRICTDPLRMRQILLNLVGNAIKFTQVGGVQIDARRDDDGQLLVSVSDSGIGIAPDRVQGIFNPFEQADNATSRQYGGTGLGLTISRQLAELLGGTLTVRSVMGEGSCFTLALPLTEASEQSNDQQVAMPQAVLDPPPEGRILLAEDHDINRILTTAMLERCGQRVTHAPDGQVAVDLALGAARNGKPFDLILMDVQMPRMDGFDAARAIRAAGVDAQTLPILALTANGAAENRAEAEAAGLQGHLAKPLRYGDLCAALNQWLPAALPQSLPIESALPTAPEHSPDLTRRWQMRRTEALEAVAQMIRNGEFTGETAAQVARTAHQLAGTAAMFGESELGIIASDLENALKGPDARKDAPPLAERLLRAA